VKERERERETGHGTEIIDHLTASSKMQSEINLMHENKRLSSDFDADFSERTRYLVLREEQLGRRIIVTEHETIFTLTHAVPSKRSLFHVLSKFLKKSRKTQNGTIESKQNTVAVTTGFCL
jgi:hypothetical protein